MSIRRRATLGAAALFGGLLVSLGAWVTRSDAQLQYQLDQKRHEADPEHHPAPPPPRSPVAGALLVLGLVSALSGPVLIFGAMRDMTRDIGDAQLRAEAAMRLAIQEKRPPKPNP